MKTLQIGRQGYLSKPAFISFLSLFQTGMGIVQLLLTILVLVLFYQSATKKPPAMVQLLDGRAMPVKAVDPLERQPQTIREFVKNSMVLLMNTSSGIGDSKKQPIEDQGIAIKIGREQKRISTSAFQASILLNPKLRQPLITAIAAKTPAEAFTGQYDRILVPRNISTPKQTRPGIWEITITADLRISNPQDQIGIMEPFNKLLTVQAVEPVEPTELSSPIARVVYQTRASGLEIIDIKDLGAL